MKSYWAGWIVLLAAGCPALPQNVIGCQATFNGSELTIRNGRIERRWQVENGLLHAVSLRDLSSGREWLRHIAAPSAHEMPKVTFSSKRGRFGPVEAESLEVELAIHSATPLLYRFQVFPDGSGISTEVRAATVGPVTAASEEGLEALDLAPQHLSLKQVNLFDQTDIHNELVFERNWLLHPSERIQLEGNLFSLEDTQTGAGLVFLKEAPLPHARPVKSAFDFAYEPATHRALLAGGGYRVVTMTYTGGAFGYTEALHRWQRNLRPYVPGRDGMFLSNTWGDRSRDARIQDAFLRREIEAGARLGVDVVQIDDGWQQGRTQNSAQGKGVWNGFWAADPGFWNVNRQRFPQGLAPIVELAQKKGMGFGLWFAPDSSNEFSNWERDAQRLLELHRALGINYFKIDGVKATTKTGEERLHMLFDRVLRESEGRVVFDLDVTAEIRPGYFGAISAGPLFVENRYTDSRRYWPHQTLRNFWELAHYVDPLRLRIEFLNNSRNTALYEGDPLAPAAYSPACLFAITMMANPLGWFEISGLPPQYFDQVSPLVAIWKREREAMQAGRIFPIGNAPDGFSWTGFISVSENSRGGYLLVFRERNANAAWSQELPVFGTGEFKLKLLAGEGSGALRSQRLEVTVPDPLGFAWFRLEPGVVP